MTLSCRASLDLELGYLIPWTCLVPNGFYFVILFRFLSVTMALCGAAALIHIYNKAFRCYYTPSMSTYAHQLHRTMWEIPTRVGPAQVSTPL